MQYRTRMESSLRRGILPAHQRQGSRRAFTLIEVLLTLTLLVIISGVTWISLQRPLVLHRLHSAADTVRTEWCQARVDAMKSGHTYAFRYMVRGDRYHLGPQDDPSALVSSPVSQSSAIEEDDSGDDPLPPPVDKTLPQGIRFLNPEGDGDLEALGEFLETGATDDGNSWSDPIYFYADGSTSDARLMLAADRHAAMRLRLRGITGSVTVEDTAAVTQ